MTIDPLISTEDVLETLRKSGKKLQEWGLAVGGTPLVSVRLGGERKPAVLITAGVHAHECAGVFAALELVDRLETTHEVHIFPLRDPFGFSGATKCLSHAAGQLVEVSNHSEVLTYLLEYTQLLLTFKQIRIFTLGDIGFIWHPLQTGLDGFIQVNEALKEIVHRYKSQLKPLFAKPVMILNPAVEIEGSGGMQRCWHGLLDGKGQWLNLNRSFGSNPTAPEAKALQELINVVKPALILDLQEDAVDGYWLAAPHQKETQAVKAIASGVIEAIRGCENKIHTYEQMQEQHHRDLNIPGFLSPDEDIPGLFYLDQQLMSEGHNLLSYAADFGVSIGIEAPIEFPLEQRVNGFVKGIRAGIRAWENQVIAAE